MYYSDKIKEKVQEIISDFKEPVSGFKRLALENKIFSDAYDTSWEFIGHILENGCDPHPSMKVEDLMDRKIDVSNATFSVTMSLENYNKLVETGYLSVTGLMVVDSENFKVEVV